MNVVNSGTRYQIYDETVQTYRHLPAGTYSVNFHPMAGFSLVQRTDMEAKESHIYGNTINKVAKTLTSYQRQNRNFGVILSGNKGIGKTLFVRLLAQKAIEIGYPVIIVDKYLEDVSNFLSSIEQDVLVIFDEFEKTYPITNDEDCQSELLSLFDGIDGGHKLFVVTCNDVSKLNSYLVDRPGRFHYHFRMTAPSNEEVLEYLNDNLLPQYRSEKLYHTLSNLAVMMELPYDYLRAIVSELNQGYELQDTMSDLNISRPSDVRVDIEIVRKDGSIEYAYSRNVDLTAEISHWITANARDGKDGCQFQFRISAAHVEDGLFLVNDPSAIFMEQRDADDYWNLPDEQAKAEAKRFNENTIVRIILHRSLSSQFAAITV